LLDLHGERVAAPLRARVAALRVGRVRENEPADDPLAEVGLRTEPGLLTELGVLTRSRRAVVQRRVLSELVRPLALALIGDGRVESDRIMLSPES
jgi:hypothetical protein